MTKLRSTQTCGFCRGTGKNYQITSIGPDGITPADPPVVDCIVCDGTGIVPMPEDSEDPSPDPRSAAILAAREALHARGLPADDMGEAAALAVLAAMEAPRVVYLVSERSYSDHYTEGIFSTREGAQGYIDQAGLGDGRGIEEYTLDAMVGWEMGPVWVYVIALDDGEIFREYPERRPQVRHPTAAVCSDLSSYQDGRARLRVESPISADHARKVAVERRQEWLRTQEAGA